jgi:hypothetical protein
MQDPLDPQVLYQRLVALVNAVKVFIVLLDRFEQHRISAVEFNIFVQQELAHPPLCLLVSTRVP